MPKSENQNPMNSDTMKYSRAEISYFIRVMISSLRMIPHILCFYLDKNRSIILKDLNAYSDGKVSTLFYFLSVMTSQNTYRNLFYYRINKRASQLISWMCPPEKSLHITCPNIGDGCHFEHNYSTYLNAESIGVNFYCLHLVTIGNENNRRPTLGDNVKIYTGAIVIGNIHIGNNVTIGAGAVVLKDIPDNCTVVGNPAKIVKQDGKRTNIML